MELKDLATALAIGFGTIGPGIGIGLIGKAFQLRSVREESLPDPVG